MTTVARREEDPGEYSDSQEIEHNNSTNVAGLQDGGHQESDYDSQGSDSEHSDQDPESQETERRVDDDEDRSNPQYIPKRGTFYEHDDRTAASGEESANTTSETASEKKEGSEPGTERRRPPRKSEVIDRWSHDKYNETEQVPKSRDELVSIYGYDIRNEDAPPHARRNRRYGYRWRDEVLKDLLDLRVEYLQELTQHRKPWRNRCRRPRLTLGHSALVVVIVIVVSEIQGGVGRGPNKYTRTWEDEEAYRRQTAAQAPRKPPNPEDFPELEQANKQRERRNRGPRPRSKSQPTSNESLENGNNLRRNASIKAKKQEKTPPKTEKRTNNVKNNKEKMPALENLTITTTVVNNSPGQPQRKVNAAVAQQRPVPTEQGKKKPAPPAQLQQPSQQRSRSPPSAPQKAQNAQHGPQHATQQAPQPAGEQRGGSKRYSSLRQRPLAESYSPQQTAQQTPQQPQQAPQQTQQQQHRYHAEYAGNPPPANQHQSSPGPQMHPQQLIHQVHRNASQPPHGPSPPHQQLPQPPHAQQVRLGILEQQQMVSHTHHSMHNLPPQPHTMAAPPIPQAQGYAPPAMMPAQYMQPSGNNAVFAGAPMYAQPPPAPYPHQIYPHHNYVAQATQAGGVTYYSPVEQEPPPPAPRAPRRPTAAIPIVRPDRPANSSEKDNIDRIVENMFVRKPWPATQPSFDGSKEKTETRNSQETQSKESSQPNSLTSSSISTDSKPSEKERDNPEPEKEEEKKSEPKEVETVNKESISTDA
ncbi:hypothetical protein MSG28_013827 [Choristoneura fumiferana]|uniref:Uncharacterized protein n=1 Tax=Choristoneura fumiferana TaxID=7141 RepID=A0ACC0K9L3_CHOFU|nr:hypothetical protein MSG28_013827 [Choristoneura fumiferana]